MLVIAVVSVPTKQDLKAIRDEGNALITKNFDEFKVKASQLESIKPFVEELKEYLAKGVKNRQEMVNQLEPLIVSQLTDMTLFSNAVLKSSIKWIENRENFVKDLDSYTYLNEAKSELNKELLTMNSIDKNIDQLDDGELTEKQLKSSLRFLFKKPSTNQVRKSSLDKAVEQLNYIEEYSSDDDDVKIITDYNSDEFEKEY